MKYFVFALLSSIALAGTTASKKTLPIQKDLPVKEKSPVQARKLPVHLEDKKEDCDEKAKKPVEIKVEAISLSGNTGCTLDEAK